MAEKLQIKYLHNTHEMECTYDGDVSLETNLPVNPRVIGVRFKKGIVSIKKKIAVEFYPGDTGLWIQRNISPSEPTELWFDDYSWTYTILQDTSEDYKTEIEYNDTFDLTHFIIQVPFGNSMFKLSVFINGVLAIEDYYPAYYSINSIDVRYELQYETKASARIALWNKGDGTSSDHIECQIADLIQIYAVSDERVIRLITSDSGLAFRGMLCHYNNGDDVVYDGNQVVNDTIYRVPYSVPFSFVFTNLEIGYDKAAHVVIKFNNNIIFEEDFLPKLGRSDYYFEYYEDYSAGGVSLDETGNLLLVEQYSGSNNILILDKKITEKMKSIDVIMSYLDVEGPDTQACFEIPIKIPNVVIEPPGGVVNSNYTWTKSGFYDVLTINTAGTSTNYIFYAFANKMFPDTIIDVSPKAYVSLECTNNKNIKRIRGNNTLIVSHLETEYEDIIGEYNNIIDIVMDVYRTKFSSTLPRICINNIHGTISDVYIDINGTSEDFGNYISPFGVIKNIQRICDIVAHLDLPRVVNIFTSDSSSGGVEVYNCKFYVTAKDGVAGINSTLGVEGFGDAKMKNCIVEFKTLHDYSSPPTTITPKLNPSLEYEKIDCDVKIWGKIETYNYGSLLGMTVQPDNSQIAAYWLSPYNWSADMDLIKGGIYIVISNHKYYAKGAHSAVIAKMSAPVFVPSLSFTFHGVNYNMPADKYMYKDIPFYIAWTNDIAPSITLLSVYLYSRDVSGPRIAAYLYSNWGTYPPTRKVDRKIIHSKNSDMSNYTEYPISMAWITLEYDVKYYFQAILFVNGVEFTRGSIIEIEEPLGNELFPPIINVIANGTQVNSLTSLDVNVNVNSMGSYSSFPVYIKYWKETDLESSAISSTSVTANAAKYYPITITNDTFTIYRYVAWAVVNSVHAKYGQTLTFSIFQLLIPRYNRTKKNYTPSSITIQIEIISSISSLVTPLEMRLIYWINGTVSYQYTSYITAVYGYNDFNLVGLSPGTIYNYNVEFRYNNSDPYTHSSSYTNVVVTDSFTTPNE